MTCLAHDLCSLRPVWPPVCVACGCVCTGMCIGMCMDTFLDLSMHMCTNMGTDICMDICVEMYVSTCEGMSVRLVSGGLLGGLLLVTRCLGADGLGANRLGPMDFRPEA